MLYSVHHSSTYHDRRARDRITLDVPVVLQYGPDASWVETDAELVDLSMDGMQIRCDRIPQMSHRAFLVVRHLLIGDCVALGEPIRITPHGFSVRFAHANDLMQEMVRLLSEKRGHASHYLIDSAAELRVQITGRTRRLTYDAI